jgi:6-phosphogluconolactonase
MDTIAMFSVDEQSGKLNSMGWVSTKGQIPRGMNIDPSGTFLYVGNQNSDNIIVFRIDPENGSLKDPVATINSRSRLISCLAHLCYSAFSVREFPCV